MEIRRISILGAGWLGLPLGKKLVGAGYVVKGSSTRQERLFDIKVAGMDSYFINISEQIEGPRQEEFFNSDLLFLNLPPRRRQANIEHSYPQQIKLVLDKIKNSPIKYCLFVGSTSVYGNTNTKVYEDSPLLGDTASARALIKSEHLVRSESKIKTTILRMGGLVGANRKAGRFLAGKKDLPNGEAPVNLVHLEDCIGVVQTIIERGNWDKIYNVVADIHPSRKEMYTFQAQQLGLAVPSFKEEASSKFKIVSNEAVKKDLNYQFKYPDPMLF